MERVTVADAATNLDGLVSRVVDEGITIELERNAHVVARLLPAERPLTVRDLPAFLAQLPSLGEDASAFARDLDAIRAEAGQDGDPWA